MKKLLCILITFVILASTFTSYASEAADASVTSEVPVEIEYTYLPPVSFMRESVFELQGIANEYATLNYSDFCAQYSQEDLFYMGITDSTSFVINDFRLGNTTGGSTLIFTEKYNSPVVGTVAIGTPLSSVYATYGAPGFAYTAEELFGEDHLMPYGFTLFGYKTEHFYIAFAGTGVVERIYLSRRYPQTEQDDVLPVVLSLEHNDNYLDPEKWGLNLQTTQLWRATVTHFSPSGLSFYDGFIPIDIDNNISCRYYIDIYSDYTGRIPSSPSDDDDFRLYFVGVDFPQFKIQVAAIIEYQIQNYSSQWPQDFITSPDGSYVLLPFTYCTGERSGYIVYYLDGNHPYTFMQFGHYPYNHPFTSWLADSRYLYVTSMESFSIYDMQDTSSLYPEPILYLDAFDPLHSIGVSPDGLTTFMRIELLGYRGITLYLPDIAGPVQLPEHQYLYLIITENEDGSISITVNLSIYIQGKEQFPLFISHN